MSISFGPHLVPRSSVFFESALSYAIVNLKPLLPGHVLVIPKRVVSRSAELSESEVSDLYKAVHRIGPVIEARYHAGALNIATQDGPLAGQSVPHVHVHILPRGGKKDRFQGNKNEALYEELEEQKLGDEFAKDAERRPRSVEEMATEAKELSELFEEEERPHWI